MDPEAAILAFLLVVLFIFYVAYFIARYHLFSSIVLSLIIGALALSILCPKSLFDKTEENRNNNLAYLVIYTVVILVILLYIVIKVSQDIRC